MKNTDTFKNKELLETTVKNSISKREVLFKLGINPGGGNYKTLDKYIEKFSIPTTHFKGKGHNKTGGFNKKNALDLCFYGSRVQSHTLKLRLIRDGYKTQSCEQCGISHWNSEEIPLELDHIDGDRFNNNFDNLQILCPNCHAIKTRKQRKPSYSREKIKSLYNNPVIIQKPINKCLKCNTDTTNKFYCSLQCSHESKIKITENQLKELIKLHGVNYSRIAKELGVSDKTVSKWCNKYSLII